MSNLKYLNLNDQISSIFLFQEQIISCNLSTTFTLAYLDIPNVSNVCCAYFKSSV